MKPRQHSYIDPEVAYCNADTWAQESQPFFIAVDFEQAKALMFKLDEIPDTISFKLGRIEMNAIEAAPACNRLNFTPHCRLEYSSSFSYVKEQIMAGNSYLVNLTGMSEIQDGQELSSIYYAAEAPNKLLACGDFVCYSPEDFITIDQGIISAFPMKGTISASEQNAAERILADPKEKAEHATIVDLLRNDISIVANNVKVERYRYITEINVPGSKLLQVSSEITGRLLPQYAAKIGSILRQMLPAGSVSGAPKQKTLQIISNAENCRRGFYCGIMGVFNGSSFRSAVLIRYIESRNGRLYYRSGGGITHQSIEHNEYNELISKIYVPTS
jgi:para-aminobenzoate synthetase component I